MTLRKRLRLRLRRIDLAMNGPWTLRRIDRTMNQPTMNRPCDESILRLIDPATNRLCDVLTNDVINRLYEKFTLR
jgi:hypothetical protein